MEFALTEEQRLIVDTVRAFRDRRYELGIGANENIIFDNSAVFVGAIVITGDRSGANIDTRTDAAIAEIGKMICLRCVAHLGSLYFDKITNAHFSSQLCSGTQPSVWPDPAVISHNRVFDM